MRGAELPSVDASVGADRLSDLDEAFLYLERPNQPMQIGCVAEIDGRFTLDELITALEARLAPLRRFRQRPAHSTLNLRGVVWEDDPSFDVRRHVRHVALPEPGDEATLRHVVETLFATPLPGDRPLWEIHLIDGLAGGRSALLCKVHHCMSDGISALGVLERITDPVAGSAASSSSSTTPAPARDGDASSVRDAATATNGAEASSYARDDGRRARRGRPSLGGLLAGAVGGVVSSGVRGVLGSLRELSEPGVAMARLRDVGSAVESLASFVQEPVSVLPFHGKLGNGRRMIWRSFPLDEFESLRAAGDCTINDAVLTVITGALRTCLDENGVCPDDARVRILVPMSVRGASIGDESLGNLITAVFPWLPVDEEDPRERLRRVRDEMRAIKGRDMGRATGILLGLLGALPSAVEAAAFRWLPDTPLVSAACTNVRGPRRPLHLLGRRIAEVHPIMNLFQGVGLAFAVASYAGRLSVCASTDPSLLPDGERLLEAVEESLYELRSEHWRTSPALRLARGLAEHAQQSGKRDPVARLRAVPVLDEPDVRFAGTLSAGAETAQPHAADAFELRGAGDVVVIDDATVEVTVAAPPVELAAGAGIERDLEHTPG